MTEAVSKRDAGIAPRQEARTLGTALTAGLRSRPIVILNVSPEVDGGRYAIKREVGDALVVAADVFKEGHDKLSVVLMVRRHDAREWHEVPMSCINPGLDRWQGEVVLTENTSYLYTVEAWTDHFESWRDEVQKKLAAGVDVALELIMVRYNQRDKLTILSTERSIDELLDIDEALGSRVYERSKGFYLRFAGREKNWRLR